LSSSSVPSSYFEKIFELAMFAFDLYDRDSTGILEDHDLDKMIKDVYGEAYKTSHYAKQ
jgi:Ca2+-binding EF-hand superfamily protein